MWNVCGRNSNRIQSVCECFCRCRCCKIVCLVQMLLLLLLVLLSSQPYSCVYCFTVGIQCTNIASQIAKIWRHFLGLASETQHDSKRPWHFTNVNVINTEQSVSLLRFPSCCLLTYALRRRDTHITRKKNATRWFVAAQRKRARYPFDLLCFRLLLNRFWEHVCEFWSI